MTPQPRPARILYCESNVDGTIGGSHYCLLYLTEGLDRSLFDPIVVFYETHRLLGRFRDAGVDVRVLKAAPPARLPPALRLLQRALNFAQWLGVIQKRRAFLRSERIALVHLNNSVTRHHDWMLAALLNGTPCITHERGINRHHSWLSRTLAPRLRAVISVSARVRALMVERGVPGTNIRVMYDGLEPSRLRVLRSEDDIRRELHIEADQPIVGIVGNVREWKGQEVVARALKLVQQRHPRVVCLFVGDTAPVDKGYEAHLRSVIAELGLEANVRFTGFQANVPDFLATMNVAIHASIEPEPFGMVVLEAMARRKPVVGSREGGVPEMIMEGVTGFTFEPGNVQELAARLIELLDDPPRARRMGERGYERLTQRFSLRQYVSDMERFYTQILENDEEPVCSDPAAVGRAVGFNR